MGSKVPFINIDHQLAVEIIEEDSPKTLKQLLYNAKINPKEYTLLEKLKTLAKTIELKNELFEKAKLELKELCRDFFDKEADQSYERLLDFVQTKNNVSWVLFSRTFQFIPWEEKNPLEGYLPRVNPIKRITIEEQMEFIEE